MINIFEVFFKSILENMVEPLIKVFFLLAAIGAGALTFSILAVAIGLQYYYFPIDVNVQVFYLPE